MEDGALKIGEWLLVLADSRDNHHLLSAKLPRRSEDLKPAISCSVSAILARDRSLAPSWRKK